MHFEEVKQKLALRLRPGNEAVFDEVVMSNCYHITPEDIKGRIVYDIGANIGAFSSICLELEAAKVVAVEPIPNTFTKLEMNIEFYPNALLFNRAISDTDAVDVKLYREKEVGDGSNNLYDETPFFDVVKTVSLDTLVKKIPPQGGVLKLDCEGAEYDVILHSSDFTLSQFNILCLEIHADMHSKYKGYDIIENRLRELGFSPEYSDQCLFWPYPGAEPVFAPFRIAKWRK